jgi:hypothetical protein
VDLRIILAIHVLNFIAMPGHTVIIVVIITQQGFHPGNPVNECEYL